MKDEIYRYNDTDRDDGIEVVAELMTADYSWDICWVIRKDGQLYAANDSGCSCYGPFDGLTEMNDSFIHLTRVDQIEPMIEYVSDVSEAERLDFRHKVRQALKETA
jgi:hypothetical protein